MQGRKIVPKRITSVCYFLSFNWLGKGTGEIHFLHQNSGQCINKYSWASAVATRELSQQEMQKKNTLLPNQKGLSLERRKYQIMQPYSEVSNLLKEKLRYTEKTILIFALTHLSFATKPIPLGSNGNLTLPNNNFSIFYDLNSLPLAYIFVLYKALLPNIAGVVVVLMTQSLQAEAFRFHSLPLLL